jgi:hypothetical protein
LVGKADEAFDLSKAEFDSALVHSKPTREGGALTVPDREETRKARPAGRGLLLVYLVRTSEDFGKPGFVPAIAISFPASTTATPLGYLVTEQWRRDHGLLEEDDSNDPE